jgi:hypothetical protein
MATTIYIKNNLLTSRPIYLKDFYAVPPTTTEKIKVFKIGHFLPIDYYIIEHALGLDEETVKIRKKIVSRNDPLQMIDEQIIVFDDVPNLFHTQGNTIFKYSEMSIPEKKIFIKDLINNTSIYYNLDIQTKELLFEMIYKSQKWESYLYHMLDMLKKNKNNNNLNVKINNFSIIFNFKCYGPNLEEKKYFTFTEKIYMDNYDGINIGIKLKRKIIDFIAANSFTYIVDDIPIISSIDILCILQRNNISFNEFSNFFIKKFNLQSDNTITPRAKNSLIKLDNKMKFEYNPIKNLDLVEDAIIKKKYFNNDFEVESDGKYFSTKYKKKRENKENKENKKNLLVEIQKKIDSYDAEKINEILLKHEFEQISNIEEANEKMQNIDNINNKLLLLSNKRKYISHLEEERLKEENIIDFPDHQFIDFDILRNDFDGFNNIEDRIPLNDRIIENFDSGWPQFESLYETYNKFGDINDFIPIRNDDILDILPIQPSFINETIILPSDYVAVSNQMIDQQDVNEVINTIPINILNSPLPDINDDYLDSFFKDGFFLENAYKLDDFNFDNDDFNSKTGGNYIKLIEPFNSLKCILKIKNINKFQNECFLICVISHLLNIRRTSQVIIKYEKYFKSVDEIGGCPRKSFLNYKKSVTVLDIENFSNEHKLNIKIYQLLNLENGEFSVCLVKNLNKFKKNKTPVQAICLLYYEGHYSLIKNEITFLKISKKTDASHFCIYCSDHFFSSIAKEKHEYTCIKNDDHLNYKIVKKGSSISFKNNIKKLYVPFVFYADIESVLIKNEVQHGLNTMILNTHSAIAIGVCFINNRKFKEYRVFEGPECIDDFILYIKNKTKEIKSYSDCYNILMNKDKDKICAYCELPIETEYYKTVENHVLLPSLSNFHPSCYSMAKKEKIKSNKINIVFHNLKGYDSHFIIDKFGQVCNNFFSVPKSSEKAISFSGEINNLKVEFIDSLEFIKGSLDSLSKNLSSYKFLDTVFDAQHLKYAKEKLPFPYEYIDKDIKLNEKQLPPDCKWTCIFTNENVPQEKIKRARDVFTKMNCTSIKDYMLFYLQVDVLLLAEVFENFRDVIIDNYGLDPCNYITTPGLAWDSALNFIKNEDPNFNIELLDNNELVKFFGDSGVIRGGISTTSSLKCKEDINLDVESILYLDVTNLYGYAMMQPLPYGGFEFLSPDEWSPEMIKSIDCNGEFGYVLEVDLKYPSEILDLHNDLPFFPRHLNNKLIPCFLPLNNYRVYLKNLQQGLAHGVELLKVHKVLKFNQKPWLRKYIEFNTKKRNEATCPARKNFFKLMNNAVYGKTMENVLNRSKWKFYSINDESKMVKDFCKNKISYFKKYTSNLYIAEKVQCEEFNKPIYVGFTVLEISKYHMYDLLYNKIKKNWPSVQLMYMDTDSFVIYIDKKYDEAIQYKNFADCIDTAEYPNGSTINKGQIGTLKDEFPMDPIKSFIALRAKTYFIELQSKKIIIKNKGCQRSALDKENFKNALEHEDYKLMQNQITFKSNLHVLHTEKCNKIILKGEKDNKRENYGYHKTNAIGYNLIKNSLN